MNNLGDTKAVFEAAIQRIEDLQTKQRRGLITNYEFRDRLTDVVFDVQEFLDQLWQTP